MKTRLSPIASFIITTSMCMMTPVYSLTITGNFTNGPCPITDQNQIPDGATCPAGSPVNSATGQPQCPAFYNPNIIPGGQGFNTVSYCTFIGTTVIGSGPNFYTRKFTPAEQDGFYSAAKHVQGYVKDNLSLNYEAYAVGSVAPPGGVPGIVALATEFFTPVCMSDTNLPPFTNRTLTTDSNIGPLPNGNGTFTYKSIPQTYDAFVSALQAKNAKNKTPFPLTNYIPSAANAVVQWSTTFQGQVTDTTINAWNLNHMFLDPATNGTGIATTPFQLTGVPPFTVCGSPANMRMLGLDKQFNTGNYSFAQINSPQTNIYNTIPNQDGVYVAGDFPDTRPHGLPYSQNNPSSSYVPYITDESTIVATQLPKAFYIHHNLQAVYTDDCDVGPNGKYLSDKISPTTGKPLPWCSYPKGFNWGINLIGTTEHELLHLMGLMWSEYYKQPFEGNVFAYALPNAHFVLDLFILDADSISNINPNKLSTYTSVPRNMESNFPIQHTVIKDLSTLEPWVQYGKHDHVFVFLDNNAVVPIPLMNYSIGNPDGDIARQTFRLIPPCTSNKNCTSDNGNRSTITNDPYLLGIPDDYVLHGNLQANSTTGTIEYATERELHMMSALGWDVDFSYLKNNTQERAPTANWYDACFIKASGGDGTFDTFDYKKKGCVFSVAPAYTATCTASTNNPGPGQEGNGTCKP